MFTAWIGFFRFHGLLLDAPGSRVPVGGAGGGSAGAGRGQDSAAAHRVPTGPESAVAPVILVRHESVWDADRAARAQGVGPGQGVAEARSRCPRADWRTFDPASAAQALSGAWALLTEASSTVEPDAAGRPEAYAAWAGEALPLLELRALSVEVGRRLPHVDLAVGLASSRLVARMACPSRPGVRTVAPGEEWRLLAPLPLAALVGEGLLSPGARQRLEGMGVRRCGEVVALPAAALRGRLGREGQRLRDLCTGLDRRPVRSLYPPRAVAVRRVYPEGLPPGAREAAAAEVARQAAASLAPAEGTRRLCLCVDGTAHLRTWDGLRRDPVVLSRAAASLAAQAAGARAGWEVVEVRLEDLGLLPTVACSLLPPLLGDRRARPSEALEDLLERWSRAGLRRGCGPGDRYDRLLDLLDPWAAAP